LIWAWILIHILREIGFVSIANKGSRYLELGLFFRRDFDIFPEVIRDFLDLVFVKKLPLKLFFGQKLRISLIREAFEPFELLIVESFGSGNGKNWNTITQ
jgi:hypothetical protein